MTDKDDLDEIIEKLNITNSILKKILSCKNKTIKKVSSLDDGEIKKYIQQIIQMIEKMEERNKKTYSEKLKDIEKQKDKSKKKQSLIELLEEINENIDGKIRTYVRLKPLPLGEDSVVKKIKGEKIKGEGLNIICKDGEDKTYGPFKKIFDGTKTNSDIFLEIESFFNWENIKNKTAIFMNYGVSGSGKTFTFFGKTKLPDEEKGMILNNEDRGLIGMLINKHVKERKKIKLVKILEECLDMPPIQTPIRDNFHQDLKKSDDDFISKYTGESANIDINKIKGKVNGKEYFKDCWDYSKEIKDEVEILDIMSKIAKKRIENKTIKKTPFNDESNRSHLYLLFEISSKKDYEKGYIVFLDTAGRESPLEILREYLGLESTDHVDNLFSFEKKNFKTNFYSQKIKNKIKEENKISDEKKLSVSEARLLDINTIQRIYEIHRLIEESLYINESLNHLVKFLEPSIKIEQIKPYLKFYTMDSKPNTIKTLDVPIKNTKISEILKSQTSLTTRYNFLMICNTTQERKQCNTIQSTFNFVDKIKSTPTINLVMDGMNKVKSKRKNKKKSIKKKSKKKGTINK